MKQFYPFTGQPYEWPDEHGPSQSQIEWEREKMSEPTGYRFLLPGGAAVEKVLLAEVGGVAREIDADEVAALRAVGQACQRLFGLVIFEADPHAFANGVTAAHLDEGEVRAGEIIAEVEQALAAAGLAIGIRERGEVEDDPFGAEDCPDGDADNADDPNFGAPR